MQVVCLPLNESDNITASDPVTVLDPGTGQDERCQVEPDWLMPYANGVQRCLRVTFPAVVDPGMRTTFQFRRSDAGAEPPFAMRQNVRDGLVAAGLRFFGGPAGHHVDLKAPGAPLPEPFHRDTRSVLYRWFGRIYEPQHAPSVRTQLWCELEIEVFHDEDYAEFSTRWGVCDPRIDEPNGLDRRGLSDAETQIGFEVSTRSPSLCQPVPFFPEQCVVSLAHDGSKWRWVQDQRNRYSGQVLNDILPWGVCAQARGVLLFRGQNGTTGDPLRDASLQAFLDLPEPVFAIADTWRMRQEAYGPVGFLPRVFKKHEHYDRTRDAAWVRGRLEVEARSLVAGSSPSDHPYIWYKDNVVGMSIHQAYGSTNTGTHGSWQKLPHYPACAYAVPGLGLYVEKYMQAFAAPYAFREVNGNVVSAFDHPELDIDRLSPGLTSNNGDMLGKSALQAWHTNATGYLLRAPVTVAGSVAPPNEGTAESHFDQPMPFVQAAVFGSRNMRRMAESLTYTAILGGWQANSWNAGRTGQPRGLQRGGIMHSWAMWMFGADTRLADRCYDVLYLHYYKVAFEATNNQFGLSPNRVVRTVNIIGPNGSAGPDRVELRYQRYFRPWEDALGVGGWYGIARLGSYLRPELAIWKTIAKDLATDCFRYGMPVVVDERGRVVFRYLRPAANGGNPSIFEPGAAVAIGGNDASRALTQAEMLQNNWELCSRQSGNCGSSNDGFLRLGTPGAGTGAFTTAAASYLLELDGAADDILLTRHLPELFTARAGIPGGSTPQFTWLTGETRWPIAFESVIFGRDARVRGTMPISNPSGASMSRQPGLGGEAWIVSSDDPVLYRVVVGSGQVTQSITPGIAPQSNNWMAVQCVSVNGFDLVCLLDGADPRLDRSSYNIVYAPEQATSIWQSLSFTFPDGRSRVCTGFAFDPNVGQWIVLARRPAAGNEGEASVWRVPFEGGEAASDDAATVIDVDKAQKIDILSDGRLMTIMRTDGAIDTYAFARGGYWGSPRTTYHPPVGTTVMCFTDHPREDDALRVIMLGTNGSFHDVEL